MGEHGGVVLSFLLELLSSMGWGSHTLGQALMSVAGVTSDSAYKLRQKLSAFSAEGYTWATVTDLGRD